MDAQKPEVDSALRWLQLQTLPGDEVLNPVDGYWWLGRDGEIPACFIGMTMTLTWPGAWYVARCGVLPSYRGQKLQQRMLRTLERKAKEVGIERLISTTYCNPASANSFIACGYKTYEPEGRWGALDTIYWLK